jgi:murein DD-endopeptidase MepM/ murein hydrolase activator NlpD
VSVDGTYRYATTAQGKREPHHGVEFLNSTGTPVLAAGEGVVYYAGPDTEVRFSPWGDFYGNVVVIQHADDLFTLYAHLSRIDVQTGQQVLAGEVVGAVGQSGVATGSHLHFEVRQGEATDYFSTRNPELWLIPELDDAQQVSGAITLSIVNAAGDFQSTTLTLQRYSAGAPEKTFYLETYVPEMTRGPENAALNGLKAGRYRIALKLNGYLYERWVDVQSGKLTQVVIVVK